MMCAVPWHCREREPSCAEALVWHSSGNGKNEESADDASLVRSIALWIEAAISSSPCAPAPHVVTVSSPRATLSLSLSLSLSFHASQVFHALEVPEISITNYLARIVKYGEVSTSTLVIALIYVDRLIRTRPEITLHPRTAHRLVLSATLIAAKYNEDVHLSNGAFATIGGVTVREVNRLEAAFLGMCGFSLAVPPGAYQEAVSAFAEYGRAQEGEARHGLISGGEP